MRAASEPQSKAIDRTLPFGRADVHRRPDLARDLAPNLAPNLTSTRGYEQRHPDPELLLLAARTSPTAYRWLRPGAPHAGLDERLDLLAGVRVSRARPGDGGAAAARLLLQRSLRRVPRVHGARLQAGARPGPDSAGRVALAGRGRDQAVLRRHELLPADRRGGGRALRRVHRRLVARSASEGQGRAARRESPSRCGRSRSMVSGRVSTRPPGGVE
jgi:hypothetical protein